MSIFSRTCLVDQFAPEAGLDTVHLLEHEGIKVHFPEQQTCCGQPAYNSGYPDEARAVARQQLELVSPALAGGRAVRILRCDDAPPLSRNCLQTIRHCWPRRRELAERIFELTEFLVHVVDFKQQDLGTPCTVALHTSCHARREMGSHETSAALLNSLSQVNVVEQARAEECCGFGGTFAIRYPEISEAIVSDKVESLRATGAERVVSADCGCLFNILGRAAKQDEVAGRSTASLPGEHIASFLWRRTSKEQS